MEEIKKTKAQLIQELQAVKDDRDALLEMHATCDLNPEKSFLSKRFLRDMIANNPISVQIVNKQGITIEANQAHKDLFEAQPPPDWIIFEDPQLLEQGYGPKFKKLKQGFSITLDDS
jgi:hypothetical protein